MRVEACANGRAAEGNAGQLVDGTVRAADRFFHLPGVALELLAEADRRRVLEVRAAGLDNRPELAALGLERLAQLVESRDQLVVDGHCGRQLDRARDHVVRRLTEVDVVVRMNDLRASLAAEDLGG